MEKIKFNEEKAMYFIKEALLYLNFPDNLVIKSYILDNDQLYFQVDYEMTINNKIEKRIKPLTRKNVIELMRFSLQLHGYDIPFVDIKVRDEKIIYSISANIVSYGNSNKRKRR